MQTAIKTRSRGWDVSIPLPKIETARQYRRILQQLGKVAKIEPVTGGFVVKHRPKASRGQRKGGESNVV